MSDPEPTRRQRLWHIARDWMLPILGAVVLFLIVGAMRAPSLPDSAPDFTLADLDGGTVTLSELRGQTVVLNFWATWCGPCRVEIPSFVKFARNNPDVVILGIAADGPPSKLRVESRRLGITYPVLVGDRETLAAYGIEGYPTTVVVGPQGEVVGAHMGLMFRPQLWWLTR